MALLARVASNRDERPQDILRLPASNGRRLELRAQIGTIS